MYKIAVSSWSNVDEKMFIACKQAGISLIEISLPSKQYAALPYEKIVAWSKAYGVRIWSLHLPFYPGEQYDISSPSSAKNAVAALSEIIKKAAAVGVDKFVVHASGEPISDAERAQKTAVSKASLYALAECAKNCGAVIAVENLPRTCLGKNSAEILDLISAHPSLKVCFDTNHLLCEGHVDFIRNVGDKIVTTHVSDFDFVNERHWLPGEGKVDWTALLRALKEVGYLGPWLYELSFTCPKTIYRDRDLTCEDLVRNAREAFEGKPFTVFSRPKENLGMWE